MPCLHQWAEILPYRAPYDEGVVKLPYRAPYDEGAKRPFDIGRGVICKIYVVYKQ